MAQQIHVDVLSDCLAMGKTVESFVSAFFLLIQKLQGRPVRMQPICAAKTKDFGVSSFELAAWFCDVLHLCIFNLTTEQHQQ